MINFDYEDLGYETFVEYLRDKSQPWQERLQVATIDMLSLEDEQVGIVGEAINEMIGRDAERCIEFFADFYESLPKVFGALEKATANKKNKDQ